MCTLSKVAVKQLPAKQGDQPGQRATPPRCVGFSAVAASLVLLAPLPAGAVDGCIVLLCLAAPNWRAVPQCVPPIRQVFRDLARGRALPNCTMGGAGNSFSHSWASAPGNCPPHYTQTHERANGTVYSCNFSGSISVSVQGAPFVRTWWSPAGDSVTEYSATAKAQLGSWDTRFDDDYTAWRRAHPAPAAPIQ